MLPKLLPTNFQAIIEINGVHSLAFYPVKGVYGLSKVLNQNKYGVGAGELSLPPGRELDALVAEKVMRWTRKPHTSGSDVLARFMPDGSIAAGAEIPPYSTDIAAAMEVRIKAGVTNLVWIDDGRVMARFGSGENDVVVGQTEAHAICLAALRTAKAVAL